MYVKTRCPHCSQKLKINEERRGAMLRCPGCKRRFLFDSFEPPSGEHTPAQGPAATREAEPVTGADLLPQGGPEAGEQADTLVSGTSMSSSEVGSEGTSRGSSSGGTNASFFISFIMGAILTAAFYAPMWGPLHGTKLSILFVERSWVQYSIVFLTAWAGSILALKLLKLRKQTNSLLFDVLPREIASDIRPDNADQFRTHILGLPLDPSRSFLLSRVLRALEHLKFRGNVQEVSNLLGSQADLQTAAMDTSYTMVRVFIWAVPILGFIGTVMGISAAVDQFSNTIQGATDVAQIQASLKGVTTGLAVAFDTTLVALVMSIILMFPTNWLQKSEEELLSSVSDYCNEELLSRLDDGTASKEESTRGDPEGLGRVAEQLQGVGSNVSEGLARGWAEVQKEIRDLHTAQAREQRDAFAKLLSEQGVVIKEWAEQLKQAGAAVASQVAQGWRGVQEAMEARSRQEADQVSKVIAETTAERKAFSAEVLPAYREHAARLEQVGDTLRETAGKVQAEIAALQARQAQGFQDVCANLAGNLRQIQEEARNAGAAQGKALEDMVAKCADGLAKVAGEGEALRKGMEEELESIAPSLRGALEALSGELAGELRSQLGGMDRLSAAVAANAGKVAASLDSLRTSEAGRLEKAVASLESLSNGVKTDLPSKIASHMEVLEKTLKGYAKLTEFQRAISAHYQAFVKTDTLPRTVSSLSGEVAKLGPILERVEERLEALKPQHARWLRFLTRKGNGART